MCVTCEVCGGRARVGAPQETIKGGQRAHYSASGDTTDVAAVSGLSHASFPCFRSKRPVFWHELCTARAATALLYVPSVVIYGIFLTLKTPSSLSRTLVNVRMYCCVFFAFQLFVFRLSQVGGVVETNRPDTKNAQYQACIKQGDLLLNRVQKLGRVVDA